jgi:hypothetical protein
VRGERSRNDATSYRKRKRWSDQELAFNRVCVGGSNSVSFEQRFAPSVRDIKTWGLPSRRAEMWRYFCRIGPIGNKEYRLFSVSPFAFKESKIRMFQLLFSNYLDTNAPVRFLTCREHDLYLPMMIMWRWRPSTPFLDTAYHTRGFPLLISPT